MNPLDWLQGLVYLLLGLLLTPLFYVQPLQPWVRRLLRVPRRQTAGLTPRALIAAEPRYGPAWRGLLTDTLPHTHGEMLEPRLHRAPFFLVTGTQEGPSAWD